MSDGNDGFIEDVAGRLADHQGTTTCKSTREKMSDENDGLGAGRPEEEIQPADHQTTTCKSLAGTRHEHIMQMVDSAEKKRQRDEEGMKWPTGKEKNKERTVIQKVPETILQNGDYEEYLTPKVLSIGPIHAGDYYLYEEELKLKLAECYIEETGRQGGDLYREIKEELIDLLPVIKMSFDEEVINTYTDEELIDLLFLDGCAMLGFIHSYVNKKLSRFPINNEKAALIQQDLFLLENQIPFTVLEVLMSFGGRCENEENLIQDFCRFIALTSTFPRDITEYIVMDSFARNPVHFLDLFRQVLLFKVAWSSQLMLNVLLFIMANGSFILWCFPLYCMVGLSRIRLGCTKYFRRRQSKNKSWPIKYYFRNVQELKKAGIEFKPSESLTAISFHPQLFTRAKLMLPTLFVDNSTEKKLFNLVIFEMCLREDHQNQEPWITSYVNLLDLLVDKDQDVKDLSDADILQNGLGTNTDVANLINRIGSKRFTPRKDTYEDVKKKVEKHCMSIFRCTPFSRKCSLWMTQVSNTHFSSPWSILALVAAITVLVLTAVQTYFAAYPNH